MVKVGQMVYSKLYGGRSGIIYDIQGEQAPETVKTLGGGVGVTGGKAVIHIVFVNGTKTSIPEALLYGVQWKILDTIALPLAIQTALDFAEQCRIDRVNADNAEKERKENTRKQIIEDHPELITVADAKQGRWAVGAANIRKELAKAFPGVKFSVKSDRYSGGCSIDVNWTDGPTTEEVTKITGKYQEVNLNGMEDIYDFNHSNVWPEVFGGARCVFENRSYSQETEDTMVRELGYIGHCYRDTYGGLQFKEYDDLMRFRHSLSQKSFFEKGGK
jgi:hypothetical protein